MSTPVNKEFDKPTFIKSSILPGVWLFLIPILTLLFFEHAENKYDSIWRDSVLNSVSQDTTFQGEAKELYIENVKSFVLSDELTSMSPADARNIISPEANIDYSMFRWLIRISWFAIGFGIIVIIATGISVRLSMRSQRIQYLCLSSGFFLLRIFSTVQVILQGIMLVALSYWVTALWFEVYFVKIIGIVAIFALIAIFLIIKAIFTKIDDNFSIRGEILDHDSAPWMWSQLESLCAKLGTSPPDQIIAEETYKGKSLFVSLSLLKQLSEQEASGVIAHEMAHFSGEDTMYTSKIAPLLKQYNIYLINLYEGGLSIPVYYFMLAFRNLFQLSLGQVSREREYRADKIAAEHTSKEDLASALIKIGAYSKYRNEIETTLFDQEEQIEQTNIKVQIDEGFPTYLESLDKEELNDDHTSHPFDSHPPQAERFAALDTTLEKAIDKLSEHHTPNRWYHEIQDSDKREAEQWETFEKLFSDVHEENLIYVYLPSNDTEREFLTKHFPEVTLQGKKEGQSLTINCEQIKLESWPEAMRFDEIKDYSYYDRTIGPQIGLRHVKGGKEFKLPVAKFDRTKEEVIELVQEYYGRYLAAVEHRDIKAFYEKSEAEEAGKI